MLYLIGLGLGDFDDISVKGLKIVKKCEEVYLEYYTSILYYNKSVSELEKFYGRSIKIADRELIEMKFKEILDKAKVEDVAILVIGDPLSATTHTSLLLQALDYNVEYEIIHNASIITAVGCCGLQLYNFGYTVSIPIWKDNWRPKSFVNKIIENKKRGLHTLCLLDIRVKEKNIDAMIKGLELYDEPEFMTCCQAAKQILESIETDNELSEESYCIGLARVGSKKELIVRTSLKEMSQIDMGEPLHCLIIEGELHPIEKEMLENFNCSFVLNYSKKI